MSAKETWRVWRGELRQFVRDTRADVRIWWAWRLARWAVRWGDVDIVDSVVGEEQQKEA